MDCLQFKNAEAQFLVRRYIHSTDKHISRIIPSKIQGNYLL